MTQIVKIALIAFAGGCAATVLLGNIGTILNPYFLLSAAVLVVALSYSWYLIRKR